MGRLLHQSAKRILREIRTTDGTSLNVVAYRIPAPGYKNEGCGPRPLQSAHPDDLVEGMFAAAVENEYFGWLLDQIEPGTSELVRSDAETTVTVNGLSGARLSMLLMSAQRAGITPILIRATEVRSRADAERFLSAWRSPELLREMRETAPLLLTRRDCDADAALVKKMRSFGVPLRHKEVVGKDGRPVESRQVSNARAQLRRILDASSRITGG